MSRARLVFSALLSLLAFGQMWAQGVVVSESFKNSTVSGWTFAGSGYTPTLTSGTAGANGNATGDGWLRLTDTSGNAATSAYYNTAFNSTNTMQTVLIPASDPRGFYRLRFPFSWSWP